ncbi:hypothetical protein LTR78_008388 [Recurvomyces mirabilis]|uniref:Uncharacterized protein n=1 Tax=Recurvomyces mirabilis TaxID=574656 RepID=A0AAE0WIY8_9PEZI|nr:hypothetical protein LTR78_008388 [Recurvomyces mirabilis]KAK5155375.1 hypothetical protein LTS14_005636 [Recurvomyces mirabilis]
MPATNEAAKTAPPPSSTSAPLSKADQDDLAAIDNAVDRMRTLTPADPYVLTIPQDVEPRYHHAYQYQAMQWLNQTPFEWKEGEYTQYQTFIYHEHGKDMYVLHNSEPREEEGTATSKAKVGGASTPSTGAPKKKISLDAYKKSKTGAGTPAQAGTPGPKAATEGRPHAAVKGPIERVKAETDEVLAAVTELEEVPLPESQPVKKELKRKREEHGDVEGKQKGKEGDQSQVEDQPAVKKARTSSPPPSHSRKEPVAERNAKRPATPPAHSQKTGLPPKLSPPMLPQIQAKDLPPKLSPLRVPDLPRRLSPTIPANIAATLKARDQLKASSSSDLSLPSSASKNGTLTPPPNGEIQAKRKSPVPRNAFRASSSSPAVRTDGEERAKPTTTSAPRDQTPELSQSQEIVVGNALDTRRGSGKPSRIVRMKYKKHQREGIRRILKMRPNPAKDYPASPPTSTSAEQPTKTAEKKPVGRKDVSGKGGAQEVGPPARGTAQKVGRVERAGVDGKRGLGQERALENAGPEVESTALNGARSKQDAVQSATKYAEAEVPKKAAAVKPTHAATKDDTSVVAEKQPLTRKASQEDSIAKSKAPEMKRYEPPARRKESASKSSDDTAAAKAKQKPEQPKKANETSLKRKEPPKTSPDTEAEGPPAKRKKIPEAITTTKEPSTPIPADLSSPTLLKSQQATPSVRKDMLSAVAMVREQSNEGNANTPLSAKSSTPLAANGQTSQPTRAPSSQAKTQKQQAWETEQKRLERLGRELKHAASAHVNKAKLVASGDQNAVLEQRLAAIKAIESLLAYFLAFTSADEAALAAEPKQSPAIRNWQSLHGFFSFVKRTCEVEPVLAGLASHLGVVYAGHILTLSAAYGKTLGGTDMGEVVGVLVREAKITELRLDLDAVMRVFPLSWAGRLRVGMPGTEDLGPGRFNGGYKMGFGVQMSPLVAARAGFGMLREWIDRKKLGCELQLRLDGDVALDEQPRRSAMSSQ